MEDNIRFGIVQGRLTQSPPGCLQWFPQDSWQKEFYIASNIGINYIELIAEIHHNPKNPIWSDSGVGEIKELVKENKLTIHALCNDYIVKHSFLLDEVVKQNIDLLERGAKLGIEKYIMPFFEHSELSVSNMEDYVEPLRGLAKVADDKGILVCLETILTGEELIKLLDMIKMPNVKVVFDTGNRVAFGHNLARDIRLLGDSIAHVHIKDKNTQGQNVLLGSGMVNFYDIFQALSSIDYRGCYTFETTRGVEPIKTSIFNKQFTEFYIENFN